MVLPKEMAKSIPKTHLLSEEEWRSIGVQQSKGWMHYMIHEPGKHIIFNIFYINSCLSKMFLCECLLVIL